MRETETPVYAVFTHFKHKEIPEKLYLMKYLTVPVEDMLSSAVWSNSQRILKNLILPINIEENRKMNNSILTRTYYLTPK